MNSRGILNLWISGQKSKIWIFSKDAGFVYESLRNNTNRVFWDFWPYVSNPQYKSFEKRYTNRIHNTNLMKHGLQNESTIQIFWMQYGFANPKYGIRMDSYLFKVRLCTKIREDSLDSWKQVESFENWLDLYVQYETNLSKSGFVNHSTIRRDSYRKVGIEPFWSQDSYSRYGTNPWIRETNPCFYKSLIRFPHP
jgi:hypothetical protein